MKPPYREPGPMPATPETKEQATMTREQKVQRGAMGLTAAAAACPGIGAMIGAFASADRATGAGIGAGIGAFVPVGLLLIYGLAYITVDAFWSDR